MSSNSTANPPPTVPSVTVTAEKCKRDDCEFYGTTANFGYCSAHKPNKNSEDRKRESIRAENKAKDQAAILVFEAKWQPYIATAEQFEKLLAMGRDGCTPKALLTEMVNGELLLSMDQFRELLEVAKDGMQRVASIPENIGGYNYSPVLGYEHAICSRVLARHSLSDDHGPDGYYRLAPSQLHTLRTLDDFKPADGGQHVW